MSAESRPGVNIDIALRERFLRRTEMRKLTRRACSKAVLTAIASAVTVIAGKATVDNLGKNDTGMLALVTAAAAVGAIQFLNDTGDTLGDMAIAHAELVATKMVEKIQAVESEKVEEESNLPTQNPTETSNFPPYMIQ